MATAVIETASVPLIYGKIQAIREQVGAVRKEGKGGVPYNFRGVDQVVNAIYPALNEHGVIVFPIEAQRELTQRLTGGTEKNGVVVGQKLMSTSDITLTLKFVAVEDGSSITVQVAGESQDYSDKSTAQAHSVAYRIALLQTFTLPTDAPDPELSQVKAGGVEDVVGTKPAASAGPTAASLQEEIKGFVKNGATNPETGETVEVTGSSIDAIALRIYQGVAGKDSKLPATWKHDANLLAEVVAEIKAGKRA